jgi:hypothetical protein
MTDKEREAVVISIVCEVCGYPDPDTDSFKDAWERVRDEILKPAVEEEREACAKILDEEARNSEGLAEHCRKTERWDTAGMAGATAKKLAKMAQKIRARSESKREESGGVEDRFRPGGFWYS